MSMIVIALSDCPPKIRGDLSKWLFEVNTGVYVGKLSARVREELWDRICENLSKGKATMVYSACNEQGMEFRVHNTVWQPTDYDGLTLMRRPLSSGNALEVRRGPGTSNAVCFLKARNIIHRSKQKKEAEQGYVVVDLETTGLDPQKNAIIEIGAIHVIDHEIKEQFSTRINPRQNLPESVQKLTGITQEMQHNGVELAQGVEEFRTFIGDRKLVFHNAGFDRAFLSRAFEQCGIPQMENRYQDTMVLARQNQDEV